MKFLDLCLTSDVSESVQEKAKKLQEKLMKKWNELSIPNKIYGDIEL